MKTKTIVPSIFGVCVNFKIRTFQWSAVQLCREMALGKGGGERRLLQFTAGSSSSMSVAGPLSYRISQVGPPA